MVKKSIIISIVGFSMCVVIASVTFQDDTGLRRQLQRRNKRIEEIMEPDELLRHRNDRE